MVTETLDDVVFACNANQTLMLLDKPTRLEGQPVVQVQRSGDAAVRTLIPSVAN